MTAPVSASLKVARAAVDLMRHHANNDDDASTEQAIQRLADAMPAPTVPFFEVWGHLAATQRAVDSTKACPWTPRELVLALSLGIERSPTTTAVDFRCVTFDESVVDAIVNHVISIRHLERINCVPSHGLTPEHAVAMDGAVAPDSAMRDIMIGRSVFELVASRGYGELRVVKCKLGAVMPTPIVTVTAPAADPDDAAPSLAQRAGEMLIGGGRVTACPTSRETSDADAAWACEVLRRHEIPIGDLFHPERRRHVRAYVERLKRENFRSVRAQEVDQAWEFLKRHEPSRSAGQAAIAAEQQGDIAFAGGGSEGAGYSSYRSQRGRRSRYGPASDPTSVLGPMDYNEAIAMIKSHKITLIQVVTSLGTALNVAHRVRTRESEQEGAKLEAAIRFLAEHSGHEKEGGGAYQPMRSQPSAENSSSYADAAYVSAGAYGSGGGSSSLVPRGVRMNARLARDALRKAGIPEAEIYDEDKATDIDAYLHGLSQSLQFANEAQTIKAAVQFLRDALQQKQRQESRGGNGDPNAAAAAGPIGGATGDDAGALHRWAIRVIRDVFEVDDVSAVLRLAVDEVDESLEHLDGTSNERARLALEIAQRIALHKPIDPLLAQRVQLSAM